MNVGQEISRSAQRFAERVAVIDVELGRQFTYAELDRRVNRLANALLALGHRAGADRFLQAGIGGLQAAHRG